MGSEPREEPDNQTDIDRRFAEIIQDLVPGLTPSWERPTPHEPSGGDLTEGASDDPTETPRPSDESPDGSAERSAPPGDAPGLDKLPAQWRMPPDGSESFLDDDDETFVPAPPRPLPSSDEDIGFWTMSACLVGGPLWLLYLMFFDRYARSLWWVLACAVFVAGVIQLIMRSPKNRDDDPDDDGAVL